MFTVVGFSESQDPGGAFVNVAGVADQHMRVEGDSIYIAEFNRLIGAAGLAGTNPDIVRLTTPTLRRISPYIVSPVEDALVFQDPPHYAVDPAISIPLTVNEQLQAELNSTPGGAEQSSVLVWLADSDVQPVAGPIYSIRFQYNVALVAGAWAFAEIDFVDELPVADWAVVGLATYDDEAICARFVPIGAHHRPGAIVSAAVEDGAITPFRFGRLGRWFTFNTVRPPAIEILSSAVQAAADYEGVMDVIPL